MCGIAGFVGGQAFADGEAVAARMAAQLQHRGPDGAAYYLDEAALLVHTRLSIIDLQTGTQPIHNEDKTVWLICNGEIFNYLELREALSTRGHRFYTQSDSEVIVHLYEEYGVDFVHYLNGQFAICLWDSVSQTAVLARDRVGIAPLFYAERNEGLWFGSEVKAIVAGLRQRPTLNIDALEQLLNFWAPVSPASIFSGVREVSPGEMLVYRAGYLSSQRYWDLHFPRRGEFEAIGVDRAAERVHELLVDATQIRLRADVPVAAYLSGGLDSSIIVALVRRYCDAPLQTFSLTFADAGLDESAHQSEVVDFLKTNHSSVRCNDHDIADHFQAAIWHAETPLVRTAPVPMSLLSRLVNRQGTRVVLTGEGADEVFGGYDIFKETKLRRFWASNPESEWRPLLIRKLYPYLNLSRGSAHRYLANFFGGGVEDPEHFLFSHQPRANTTSRVKEFIAPERLANTRITPEAALIETLPADFGDWPYFCKAQYLEMKTLMPGYLLSSQGDRMLMQHSVEGRFPFLDHRLIEYVNRLHPHLKMRVLEEKFILKKSMEKYLPNEVVRRYKQPYRAPMSAALIGARKPEYVRYLLSKEKLVDYGYFEPRKVELLLKKIRTGRMVGYKDNMALVVILSTQCWHQLFVEEFEQRFCRPTGGQALKRLD
ncbi:MAG: asparagine synthase (glutamine-hydrolyzing) [Cellvibrionaceae bacterium]